MKKKGFTLVELLAVIAILAILVIIAMPNVLDMFNKAKKDAFETEVKTIIKTTEKQWISDSMGKPGVNETIYCRVDGVDCENSLKMDGNKEIDYFVKVNSKGKIIQLATVDDEYQYLSNKNDIQVVEDEIYVKVGEVAHPMTKEHYIMWVAMVTDNKIEKVMLYPEQDAAVRFKYVPGSKVYAYCNLHGLYAVDIK